jgi:Fic family protein
VDPARFVSRRFGSVVKTPGRFGFHTFVPEPLPRTVELTAPAVSALSRADRALGRLAGAGRLLPNPQVLVNAYTRREAVASSRIEGTQTTISELFEAEAGGELHGDMFEVVNYVGAMQLGLDQLQHLPISRRLIEQIHARLLSGVRGQERAPGEVRRSPNWIGSPDNRPETAVFVPPPVDEMERGLSDWEKFVNDDSMDMPPLVKCALMHYQFETLHPFLDGNGRLGRLLIIFELVSEGHLPAPLLYVSSYFETHKDRYYDCLQGVRERGDVESWIRFFLDAVTTQATDAMNRAERLIDRREAFRSRLKGSRSRAHEVVDLLLENPFITPTSVRRRLDITHQGATNLLKQLEAVGVLEPIGRRPGRANRWRAPELVEIILSPSA